MNKLKGTYATWCETFMVPPDAQAFFLTPNGVRLSLFSLYSLLFLNRSRFGQANYRTIRHTYLRKEGLCLFKCKFYSGLKTHVHATVHI